MVKAAIAFALGLMVSATAWAQNWNQKQQSPYADARKYGHDWLPYSNDINVKIYGGYSIPEKPTKANNPNLETLKYYYYRYINYPRFGGSYGSGPTGSPTVLKKQLRQEPYVTEQMHKTALVSYLLYENEQITVDEISPSDRFQEFFTIENPLINDKEGPKLVGHSVGKSMVSYVLGHAICDGYIKSVDSIIDDWPLLEGTLYHDQRITDLINMRAGDQNYVNMTHLSKSRQHPSDVSIRKVAQFEVNGTSKPNSFSVRYNYNNVVPNLILNYVFFKAGDKYQSLLDKVFRDNVGVASKVLFVSRPNSPGFRGHDKHEDGPAKASFFATRYDFLRIAVAMLNDWKNDTCVGKYLKTIYKNRKKKTKLSGSWHRGSYLTGYGGFFHTDVTGLQGRNVMVLDGYGGQMIWIDFDNSRVVSIHAAHPNYDWKALALGPIKDGEIRDTAWKPTVSSNGIKAKTVDEVNKILAVELLTRGVQSKLTIVSQTKYDRTVAGMKVRFKCLADYAAANDISDLPSEQEIESLTKNL